MLFSDEKNTLTFSGKVIMSPHVPRRDHPIPEYETLPMSVPPQPKS